MFLSYLGGPVMSQSPDTQRCPRCFRHRRAISSRTASGRWWRCRTRWKSSSSRLTTMLRSPESWSRPWRSRLPPLPSTWLQTSKLKSLSKNQENSQKSRYLKFNWMEPLRPKTEKEHKFSTGWMKRQPLCCCRMNLTTEAPESGLQSSGAIKGRATPCSRHQFPLNVHDDNDDGERL